MLIRSSNKAKWLEAVPYIFALVFVAAPILKASRPFSDGVIVSYAAESGNYQGIRYQSDSAGLEVHGGFVEALIKIGDLSGLGFHFVNDLVAIASLLLLLYEVRIYAERTLGMSPTWAILSTLLLAVFPVWSTLLASVLTFYVFALALAFLAVRLAHQSNRFLIVVGLVLAVLSFNFNSMLVLIPLLSLIADALNWKSRKSTRMSWPSFPTWLLIFLSVLFFLGQRLLNRPTGFYRGYNQLLSPFNSNSYASVFQAILAFSTFLLIPALAVVIAVSLSSILRLDSTSTTQVPTPRVQFNVGRNRAVMTIVIFAILPYLAVGKYASLFVPNLDQRHAFVLAPAIAFLTVILLLSVVSPLILLNLTVKLITTLSIGVVLVLQIGFLANGFASTINRQIFEKDLELVMSSMSPVPPEGIIQLVVPDLPNNSNFLDYEANYLMFQATGSAGYYTRIEKTADPNFNVPDWLVDGSAPTSFFVWEDKSSSCRTEIWISATGYVGLSAIIKNVLGIGNGPTLEVSNFESSCPWPLQKSKD